MILCSAVMGLGTSIGGYRIIKSVGMDMVKLKPYQGFSADLAATLCLLFSSLAGIPVSTTHTKTTAIMGVGSCEKNEQCELENRQRTGLDMGVYISGMWIIGLYYGKALFAYVCIRKGE
ncbi:MAG: anion permease [Lachnospiraceae bacterium]